MNSETPYRMSYMLRQDYRWQLNQQSRKQLQAIKPMPLFCAANLVIVISYELSSLAVDRHTKPLFYLKQIARKCIFLKFPAAISIAPRTDSRGCWFRSASTSHLSWSEKIGCWRGPRERFEAFRTSYIVPIWPRHRYNCRHPREIQYSIIIINIE
jgi:hypothetical protein